MDTLVTCDNGIAAAKEISLAKELGMTVVVTDHHEVPVEEERQVLPPADVVVDPKQEGETYPFREICGAWWPTSWWKSSMKRLGSPGRNGGNSWNLRPLPLWRRDAVTG
mgnify:CR=1 FL=1